MTYEVHPDVIADAFDLCFKSGNVAILKGGSNALHSSMTTAWYLHAGLASAGLSEDSV